MQEPGPSGQPLCKPALIKGGWGSTAYQVFRDLARGVVSDDPTEGFGFLLQLDGEELSDDLPGLFGSAGIGDLIPIPPATLRYAGEELNKEEPPRGRGHRGGDLRIALTPPRVGSLRAHPDAITRVLPPGNLLLPVQTAAKVDLGKQIR